MKKKCLCTIISALLAVSVMTACGSSAGTEVTTQAEITTETAAQASADSEVTESDVLSIVKQGMFSSGGTITEPVA